METDVLEDRSKVQVCVRVKPLTTKEERNGAKRCAVTHDNSVILGTKDPKIFTFDGVADESSAQEEIFAMVGKSITDSCIAGYNGSIFAYGQTGSGKTHTIQGAMTPSGEFLPGMKGLIPRVLDHMYFLMDQSEKASLGSVRFECRCSFLEIYKEKIMDLLNPTTLDLSIREDITRGIYVENLTEQPVSSTAEALEVLRVGATNRHVAATGCNDFSSRSHSVFTITIKSKEEKNGVVQTRYSRLNLIDLAGSERQKHSQTKGEQLKEAGHINKSLALLGNVIRALVEVAGGKHRHVPYRDSKLTFLLKDSLGGNSKTTIIATISPLDTAFAETLSTLKFAQRAKLIQNKAVVNQALDGGLNYAQYAQLQRELKRVREQLATEKARNQNKPTRGYDDNDASMDTSMSVVPHNVAMRRNNASTLTTSNTAQNEHVRRLEALFNQLRSYETIEDERRRLREGNAHLKEQCLSKDKFVQSARMIIKARDATIEALQKKTPRTGRSENESLKQEIQHLKAMVENHPELLKHARESHNRKAKLQEYKRLFGDNMKVYWEEIGKAQYLAKELSAYLERVKSKTGQQTTSSYEALLASPVASTEKKRVGWADTATKPTESQPMNWSLVSKRQKTVEDDTTSGEAKNSTAVARKTRDARKSIAWFNHEYEEEHSWDLETTETLDANTNNDTEEEPATGGLSKEQSLAMEDALRSVEDKLREEQIMRNQIERLLEEEKARASLELSKWQNEFALAQQQIDALVHEKNSLSSDLTVKNERLRSLNQNLMAKGSVVAATSSSSSVMQSSSKSRSSDSSDDDEFGDWDQVHKGFDNDDNYEPVSLRRLTMGVGLLRRVNADAHDKQLARSAKKQKKRMGSFGGDGDLGGGDADGEECSSSTKMKKGHKTNINEVRLLDLERRLAEKETEIERLQDKFNNMKEEYEVLIEEKRFREEEQPITNEGDTSTASQLLQAAQFVQEVEEMERKMKERNLDYEREVMRLREDADDRSREWEAERQEREERERQLIASLEAAERERELRETELDDLRKELDQVRVEMRREISGYVSKMGEMGRLFGEKRKELEEEGKKQADEHFDQLQRVLSERDEANVRANQQMEASMHTLRTKDEEIERLTKMLESADADLQEEGRRLTAEFERRIESLNEDVEAMQRLSDGELAKLRHELETEKERRDLKERELEEAKTKALEEQRRYYEDEMTRIKEEMSRQWAEWENRGLEDERETKGMIMRLNEEKEELIARARKERDDAELEHQRTTNLLEGRLRQATDSAQATEARLQSELTRIEKELHEAVSSKIEDVQRADEQRRAFEQQIARLESSAAATEERLTAELSALRGELDSAQRASAQLQSAHMAELEQFTKERESELQVVRAAHDSDLEQMTKAKETEIATLRATHDAALEQLTVILNEKASETDALKRLVSEKESEIQNVRDAARQEREAMEALHLQQRSEQIAVIEAKEQEMAELKAAEARARLDLEEHMKAEIEQLEQAKKTELAELEEKHGREIEELTAQEKRMMHDFAVMKDEIERSINERIDYIKQIETRRQAERQAQDEIARLNDAITRMQKDYKSLTQEKHQLEARVEELVLINGKLTGHQNLNQKIQHHVKVKQENNSLKIQLQKMKKELDRTKTELAKFRPDGSLDLLTDEDEDEKLRKQLAQQQDVIDALDAQLKSLRGQLSSLYSAHIGSAASDASSKEQRQDTEPEDAMFSFEVVLDQLGLKLKGMSQEISDLHFKKLLLERENALYAKKSQHGLAFSSSSAVDAVSTAAPVELEPTSAPSSTSTSTSTTAPSSSSASSHALADVTNFEFNALPTSSSSSSAPPAAPKEAKAAKPTTASATAASVHRAEKENAMVGTLTGSGSGLKEKPSRSGSRREARDRVAATESTKTRSSGSGSRREDREASASSVASRGDRPPRTTRVVLTRTLSSVSNHP